MKIIDHIKRYLELKKEYLQAINELNQTLTKIYEYNRGINQEINFIRNDLNIFISSTHDTDLLTIEQLIDIRKELSDLNHRVAMAAIPVTGCANKT